MRITNFKITKETEGYIFFKYKLTMKPLFGKERVEEIEGYKEKWSSFSHNLITGRQLDGYDLILALINKEKG